MTKLLRIAAAGIAILASTMLGSCSETPAEEPAHVLSEISVTIAKTSISIADTAHATAVGKNQFDKPMSVGQITWSATGAATVSQSGVITGVAVGNATIRATVVGRPMYAEQVIAVVPKPAARIQPYIGASLVARNGKPFALSAVLVDVDGKVVQKGGVVVTASYSGSGTISGPLIATTATSGESRFNGLVVSGPSGKKQITLSAPGLAPAIVPVTLVTGIPASIEVRQGDNQVAIKGDQVSVVSVTVRDSDGYGVPDALVTFEIGLGGGTVTRTALPTNAAGITGIFDWRLGATGVNTLIATAQGVTTPLTITATALPRIGSIEILRSVPAVAVGQSIQLTLKVLDDTGAPFDSSFPIQWLVDANQNGTVTSSGVFTGTSAGNATVIALLGARTSVIIPVTGVATRKLLVTSYPSTVINGVPFAVAPVVQIVDAATLAPVAEAGHVITVDILGPSWNADQTVFSLGKLTGPSTAITDASGAARFTGLGVVTRTYGVFMSFRSDGIIPVTSPLAPVTQGAPASVTIVEGDNQSAAAGAAVDTRPSVIVRDIAGNPVSGVAVTFTVTAGAGSVTGATVITEADGRATAGGWILGALGSNTLTVSTPTLANAATFKATARAY